MTTHSIAKPGLCIFQKSYLYNTAKQQIKLLDEIELNPDRPFEPKVLDDSRVLCGRLEKMQNRYQNNASISGRISRLIAKILTFFRILHKDRDVAYAIDALAFRIESLAYRRGGKSKVDDPDDSVIQQLADKVIEFKKSCPEVYEEHQHRITPHDERQIRKIARYSDLADLCLKKPHLLQALLKETIRNLYPVSCYMQYPRMTEKLHRCHISPLVSSFHTGKLLKRDKLNFSLRLRFKHINDFVDLMRACEVKVTNTLVVTMKEIFDDFHSQGEFLGQYCMTPEGVEKRSIMESWEVNPNSPLDWYKSLPADVVSTKELKRIFKDFDFEEGDWITSVASTRQSVEREIHRSHGFTRFYIPQGNGTYKVYSAGVYSTVWPKSAWDQLSFIGDTVDARWCSPDPNHSSLPQRSKAEVPTILKRDDEKRAFQERLKATFLDDKLTFAWSGDNCIVPSIKLVRNCPRGDLVLTSVSDVKPPLILWLWVKPYIWAPQSMKPIVLKILLIALGGFRTRHGKNLLDSNMGRSAMFNYPGHLHDRIRRGELPGIIYGGHNRDYEELVPA